MGRPPRGRAHHPLHGRTRPRRLLGRRIATLGGERQFEIVGEAFAALRRIDPGVTAAIPDLPRIVAFRNVLIHSYATVDDELVWSVVEGSLPELLVLLARLLDEAGDGSPSP